MVKEILRLAAQYENKLGSQVKTAAKEKVNRGRLAKKLERAKSDYSKLKSELDVLEANDSKLKQQLETTRSGAQKARKDIMQMHNAMQKMDLANANDAIFYADDEDVGYVINGKEFHLDVDDTGDVKLTPMSAHRKSKKAPKKDEGCVDENCADDSHMHFGPGSKEVKPEKDTANLGTFDDANDDKDMTEFDDLYATLVE